MYAEPTTPCRERCSQRALTMIELLVVIAIAGIVFAIAAPAMNNVLRRARVDTASMLFLSHLQLARQTAISRGVRVTMLANQEDAWEHGWNTFIDADADGELDDGEQKIAAASALPTGVTLRGNTNVKRWISFRADGTPTLLNGGFQAGTLSLCADGQSGIAIVMSRTGRVRFDRSAANLRCPAAQTT